MVWLRDWAENWLAERLTAVPGTAGAEVVGGLKREIRVHLDPVRLAACDLQVHDGRIMVKLRMPSGTSVAETDRVLAAIEKELDGVPHVRSVFALAGGRVWGLATCRLWADDA